MIIFGWRTRSRISQVERGTCPICQADRDIVVQTNKVWFTFFFVPIFPIGAVSQQRICSQCGTVFPAGWSGTLAPTRGMSFSSPPVHTNQTATTAIIALVMAVLSPALICLCYASIPASIAAIVLGHISLSSIAKAQGQLDGRGLSIASLVLAYPVLLLSIVFMSYSLFLVYRGNTGLATNSSSTAQGEQENFPGNSDADAVSRFQNAEQMILALQGDSPGHGNNAEAIRLADSFAEMMLKVRESAFTTGKKPLFQLSSGQFVTYVELHDDRALFLVHVPDYRHARGAQVLASSPRHLFVASAGKDGTIAWQTLTSPFQTKLLQHLKREPLALALPKVGVEAWAMNGETILKFSLRDASVLAEHPLGHRNARAACFNHDGSQGVLVDYRDIYLVNCQDRVEATKIYTADNDVLYSVAFHPNNRWIAVGGRGNVLILDVIDRAPLARIMFDAFLTVEHLQFSPDGKKLAVCHQSSDANIHLYEIGSL